MKIDNRRYPAGRVIKVDGEITVSTANDLKPPIQEALEDGLTIVELSQVKFIDSFGLGVLISFAKNPFNKGLFRIAATQGNVERTIKLSRLDRILTVYPSLNDALKAPGHRRIVIVDPDETTRSTAEAVLESYDYTIASEGSIANLPKGRPDLIVSAANIEGLAEYRKSMAGKDADGKDIAPPPVLLVVDTEACEESLKGDPGVCRTIAKPFDPYDLLGHARALLGEIVGGGAAILGCIKDPGVADTIEYILKHHGYRFTNQALFSAAMKELEKTDFRALLLGVDPAGATLEKAISAIHSHAGGLAIVIVGTPVSQEEVLKIVKLGVGDIVGVPISPEVLLGKMAKNVP